MDRLLSKSYAKNFLVDSMHFIYSSRFKKSVRKCQRRIQELVLERLELFKIDRNNPLLDDHSLGPPLIGVRSISVSGDLRIQYEFLADDVIKLLDFGTHSELYDS